MSKLASFMTLPLILCCSILLTVASHCFADSTPAVVYQWSPANFHPAPGNPWNSTTVNNPDGTTSMCINGTGLGYNNYIYVRKGLMKGGQDYTAIVSYQIVTPTQFPHTFYMFARSSKLGQANDIWQTWVGDAGDKGIARLPMSLKDADDWSFCVGCQGPGSMIINSFSIRAGTGYTYIPATPATASTTALTTHLTLPTGCSPITIAPPAPKKTLVLSAADFGLTPDRPSGPSSTEVATANAAAIAKAITACQLQNASELLIPKGVYRFYSKDSLPFNSLSDLVIDGQGSDFIFEKLHEGLSVISMRNCTRCVLKNLNLDWDWSVIPEASLAHVVSITPDQLSCVLTFPDLNAAQTQLLTTSPWMQMLPMDPTNFHMTQVLRLPVSPSAFQAVNPNTLQVTFKQPVPLVAGQSYCVRHLYYDMGAFRVADCNNLLYDNVTVYSMPGMGWVIGGDMSHWELHNCRIARRPGSRNPFTTSADGFHVMESLGNLILDGCEFTGCGDDCVTVHDIVYEGTQRVDDHTLTLVGNSRFNFRVAPGDTVELDHADFSPYGFTTKVLTVDFSGGNTTLTVADSLPAQLSTSAIIWNHHYDTSNLHFTNCTFHDTSGRGILIAARNVTIDDCKFDHTFAYGIDFETEIVGRLWSEGHGSSNVVIRNNVFNGVNVQEKKDGPAIYAEPFIPAGTTSVPLYHDVLIENNSVTDCSGPFITISSAQNFIVRNNQIANPDAPNSPAANLSSIVASYCSNMSFSGNTWHDGPNIGKPGVVYDPVTTSNVKADGNVLSRK